MDTVGLWLQHLRARGFSAKTVKRRRGTLRALEVWLAPVDVLAATPDLLDGFLARWRHPATLHAYVSDLRSFYGWAQTRALVAVSPADGLGPVRVPPLVPRPVTTGELRAVLGCAGTANERRAVLLAALAGLRCGEVARLAWSDVDRSAGLLRVRGKGGRERLVPLHPLLSAALGSAGTGAVVRTAHGQPFTADGVSRMGRRLFARAGVDGGLHRLRHWFGTAVQRDGHDVLATARLLGHVSVATTQGYAAADVAQGRTLVEHLSLSA